MGSCGCGENVGPVGGLGTSTAAILVLFILLVIITKSFWL
ncbi:YjcZ family sporulation protein [Paenibacillus sp. FSL L8-0470]